MKTKRGQKTLPPAAKVISEGKFTEKDIRERGLSGRVVPTLPTFFDLAIRRLFPEVEKDAPEWARQAAKMAVRSAMPPERKRKGSEEYLSGFSWGKFCEAEKLLPAENRMPSPADFGGRTDIEIAAKLPSIERADYFCGFRDGELAVKAMLSRKDSLQTVKAYRAIAIDWREAQKFIGNAGELHRWLIDKGAFHYKADPAATRTICRKIGFPTRGKAGHPCQAPQ